MFFRKRNQNVSLERPIYEPAQKDEAGKVLKPAHRTTLYLGSVKTFDSYARVSHELLDKLTDEEKGELREFLKGNEIPEDYLLQYLPRHLKSVGSLLRCLAQTADAESKEKLREQLKAGEQAWAELFKVAQDAGLRRKISKPAKRAKPVEPTAS